MHRNPVLATGVAGCAIALSACMVQGKAVSADPAAPPAPVAAASQPAAAAPAMVIDRGRRALSEAGLSSDLELLASEEVQWNDSSLGCPQPGAMYTQVITPGYVLRFADGDATRQVHVAGDAALVCSPQLGTGVPKRPAAAYRARELDTVIEGARSDLAARLGTKVEDIGLVDFEPTTWPDSRLGCGEALAGAPSSAQVHGFKLVFASGAQRYVYHTDLKRAFPCPPIEAR